MRIGIYEDNLTDRFLYYHCLSAFREEFSCELFQTPEDGFGRAQQHHFDIIFINLHFWGTDFGYVLLDQLKKICGDNTRFIAVTPFLQNGDIDKLNRSAFELYYEKPGFFKWLPHILTNKPTGTSASSQLTSIL